MSSKQRDENPKTGSNLNMGNTKNIYITEMNNAFDGWLLSMQNMVGEIIRKFIYVTRNFPN